MHWKVDKQYTLNNTMLGACTHTHTHTHAHTHTLYTHTHTHTRTHARTHANKANTQERVCDVNQRIIASYLLNEMLQSTQRHSNLHQKVLCMHMHQVCV